MLHLLPNMYTEAKRFWTIAFVFSLSIICFSHLVSAQVTFGQIDDFNDGTLQNWEQGQAGGLSNVSNSLQVDADGAGALGKVVFFNETQWQGDYLAQGIKAVKLKVNNISSSAPIFLRVVMRTNDGAAFPTFFISKDAIEIPSGSGQMEVVLPIEEADFDKSPSSGASYSVAFSNIVQFRIISSQNGGIIQGDDIVATVQFDDIEATDGSTSFSTPYDEDIDGDISDDRLAPTAIALSDGNNVISACQDGSPRDIDYFTFNVPSGKILERIDITDYTTTPTSNRAFIGIQAGNTFTEPASGTNVANLLGGLTYGENEDGTNILPEMGMLGGAMGFTPPLTTGDYTIWLNQTSTASCVTLDLIIENECANARTFNNTTIETGLFKANNTISTTGTVNIENNANVNFQAGQSITLAQGFTAPTGVTFTASIVACTNSLRPDNEIVEQRSDQEEEIALAQSDMSIYPNPTLNEINIRYHLAEAGMVQIELYDFNGKKVKTLLATSHQDSGMHNFSTAVKELQQGNYVLVLQTEKEQISRRVAVVK